MDISPSDLLSQARILTESGTGRPVFHALTAASAGLLISGAGRKVIKDYLRRGFEHRTMRNVCVRFFTNVDSRNAHIPIFKHLQLPMSTLTVDVRSVAQNFIVLQNDRHTADYDHSVKLTKIRVEELQALAQATLDLIDGLDRTDDTHYAFLVALYAERATGTR